MNRHRRYRELLARRAELTPVDERRLRDHLETCPECRDTAAAYERQWQLLRSVPPLETPPSLRASVLNRIHTAPPPAPPWYRRRPALMAPLAAAALLALVAVAWVAGSQVIARHPDQSALSAHGGTATPTSGGSSSFSQEPPFSSTSTSRTARPKRSVSAPPARHRASPVTRGRSPHRAHTPPAALPQSIPTSLSSPTQPTATPVPVGPSHSVAAGVPASPHVPTVTRRAATHPSSRHAAAPNHASRPTSRPRATPAPTSGPPALAVGPPPSAVPAPNPPKLAPIQGTPSPVAAAPSAPPVIAVTPGAVNTPMPIIPPTPTPSPLAQVYAAPSTPTPTPTPRP